ncbi:MAG: peptidase C39 family protein [Chloroflexi bacterium]|nr:peptidase C39 family protein [Chloroflexota bacterium]
MFLSRLFSRCTTVTRAALAAATLASFVAARPVDAAAGTSATPAPRPFEAWSFNGVAMAGSGAGLSGSDGSPVCTPIFVDGLAASADTATGLCQASDADEHYAGGGFVYGTLTSPIMWPAQPVEDVVTSWDATTPPGTWLQLHARVQQGNRWTDWMPLAVWSTDVSTLQRRSHKDADAEQAPVWVDTDSIVMEPGHPASAYQLEVTLFSQSPSVSPSVRMVRATMSQPAGAAPQTHIAWDTDLPVPQRSQMLTAYRGLGFGGGGDAWCSPTSTSMVMAYWGNMLHLPQLVQSVPTVAAGTYDYVYKGTGNWSFNTAYASSFGLTAYVQRFSSFDQVEPWIKASVPIVISVAWNPGELANAPIPSTPGHLIVVRGFMANGDVIVNDPAASSDPAVRLVYKRSELESVWQRAFGMAYVIYPPGWAVPTPAV